MQAEARFLIRRISSQTVNYLPIVAALSSDIAAAVDDTLTSMPTATTYDDLKRRVLQRLEPSQQIKLRQLVFEEFGDQRLSKQLHCLGQLLGECSSNESKLPIQRELFLQRLLQSAHMVLDCPDGMNHDRLAALAYRICDCPSSA